MAQLADAAVYQTVEETHRGSNPLNEILAFLDGRLFYWIYLPKDGATEYSLEGERLAHKFQPTHFSPSSDPAPATKKY